MDERFDGQLTHSIALSGERRSPYLSVIMLTDRDGAETDELYKLIPCLYALAGSGTAPHVLGQLALSAVSNLDDAIARVHGRAANEAEEHARLELFIDDLIGPVASPEYIDDAIAEPDLAELAMARNIIPLEGVEDVLMAQMATLNAVMMLFPISACAAWWPTSSAPIAQIPR